MPRRNRWKENDIAGYVTDDELRQWREDKREPKHKDADIKDLLLQIAALVLLTVILWIFVEGSWAIWYLLR